MKIIFLILVTGILWGNPLNDYYEIARESCHDISDIRREMDRINEAILLLLTERTAYVKRAGDLKSKTTGIADDRQRVADQEKKIADKSLELALPLEISLPAFRAIMETSIKYQQKHIDQLSLKIEEVGEEAIPELLRINRSLVLPLEATDIRR